MKTLMIAGNGRSGSTILGNVLGAANNALHLGELHWIWTRGLVEDWLCGCGAAVRRCVFWKKVLDGMPVVVDRTEAARMELRQRRVCRDIWKNDHLLSPSHAHAYVSRVSDLWDRIQAQGPRLVIDSSKNPCQLAVLHEVMGDNLCVVHLLRDPRAIAYSWLRPVRRTDSPTRESFQRTDLAVTVQSWLRRNATIENFLTRTSTPSIRVRYEDFVSDPMKTLKKIKSLVGEPIEYPRVIDGLVQLKTTHTISGNPGRMRQRGQVKLRLDDEWLLDMKPQDRDFVTGGIGAQLKHYGYSVQSG